MVERLDILITQTGARGVRRSFDQIGESATRSSRNVDLLRRSIGLIGAVAVARGIARTTDQYTNYQNRLRTVAETTEELNFLTEQTFQLAQRTRTSFGGTVEIYQRLALATEEIGLSSQEVLQIVETLNEAIIVSGANAQEASAGLLQLSQGLASGALRGDELRSVMEQMSLVTRLLTDEFDVNRGALRRLGAEGRITVFRILSALRGGRDEVAELFETLIPTIAQGIVVFDNALTRTVGRFDALFQGSANIARGLILLATNFETLLRLIGAATIAFVVFSGPRAIGAAILGIRALTIAIAANPLGALAVAISTVIGLLVAFSDRIRIGEESASSLYATLIVTFRNLPAILQSILRFFSPILFSVRLVLQSFQDLGNAFVVIGRHVADFVGLGDQFQAVLTALQRAFGDIELSFAGILTAAATVVDRLIGLFDGAERAIVAAFENLPAALELLFVRAFNTILRHFLEFINPLFGAINTLNRLAGRGTINFLSVLELEASLQARDAGELINEAFAEGYENSTRASDAVSNFLADIEAEHAALQARLAGGAAAGAADAAAGAGATGPMEINPALEAQAQLLEEIRGPAERLAERQMALNALFETGQITAEEYNRELRNLNVAITELDNSFSGGIANGIARVTQEANNLGTQVSDIVVGAFDSLTESIVNFARTGEFSIRRFFGTIAEELLRLSTNQLFAQLLLSFGGGQVAFGGVGGGSRGLIADPAVVGGARQGRGPFGLPSGLLGFQTGGAFTVGGRGGPDSQLVAFRATPGERVNIATPTQVQRGVGPQVNIQPQNIRIVNVIDPREAVSALDSADGEELILNIIERNSREVRSLVG